MRHLLVLGAGTAGTMVANRVRPRLARDDWQVTVVDADDDHLYQPGLLLLPFGGYRAEQLLRPRRGTLARGVDLVRGQVHRVDPDEHRVRLVDGRVLPYDHLVIATGATPRPEQTPGMLGPQWRRSIFDFYTLGGASALAAALQDLRGGRLVVHVADTPIKCPVAPLEFTFLVDAWLRHRGLREDVELTYVTPLSGAFTQPVAAARLGSMLTERNVHVEADFLVERIDDERKALVSYDEREVPFDLLVTVPVTMGADYVQRSGMGDELGYVHVDPQTLRCPQHPDVFAIGDANDIPTSKAGSVAHFCVDVVVENLLSVIAGTPPTRRFDGHANCFVECGDGKGLLIDFGYDTEPLPGRYPLAHLGPLSLLKATRANHLGKLAFRWLYWHVLLPGRPLPVPTHAPAARRPADRTPVR